MYNRFWKFFLFSFFAVVLTLNAHAKKGEVRLFCFEGYAEQEWINEFEKTYDAKVKVNYTGSVDELFAKMQGSNGEDYDLISIDTSLFSRYHSAGLIKPFDTSKFANRDSLLPAFQIGKVQEVIIDDKTYGVPIAWGSLGMLYDADFFMDNPPDSWEVMWDAQYKGKMIVLDDTNNNIVNTAIILGMKDPFNLSEREMEKVKGKLIAQKKLIRTYYAGFEEGTQVWDSGGIVLMFSMGESQEASLKELGYNVKYVIPQEGGIGWLDTWAMSSGVGDEDLAHKWVDFFLEKSTQKLMNDRYSYGTTVFEAPGLDYADRLVWLKPPEDFEWRNRIWNEVKATN